jgi:hypothetical protein
MSSTKTNKPSAQLPIGSDEWKGAIQKEDPTGGTRIVINGAIPPKPEPPKPTFKIYSPSGAHVPGSIITSPLPLLSAKSEAFE